MTKPRSQHRRCVAGTGRRGLNTHSLEPEDGKHQLCNRHQAARLPQSRTRGNSGCVEADFAMQISQQFSKAKIALKPKSFVHTTVDREKNNSLTTTTSTQHRLWSGKKSALGRETSIVQQMPGYVIAATESQFVLLQDRYHRILTHKPMPGARMVN